MIEIGKDPTKSSHPWSKEFARLVFSLHIASSVVEPFCTRTKDSKSIHWSRGSDWTRSSGEVVRGQTNSSRKSEKRIEDSVDHEEKTRKEVRIRWIVGVNLTTNVETNVWSSFHPNYYLRVNLTYCGTICVKVCRPWNWSTDLSIYFQTSVIALNGVDTVSTVRDEIWKEIIIFIFLSFFKHLRNFPTSFFIFIFSFFHPPPHMIFSTKVDQN